MFVAQRVKPQSISAIKKITPTKPILSNRFIYHSESDKNGWQNIMYRLLGNKSNRPNTIISRDTESDLQMYGLFIFWLFNISDRKTDFFLIVEIYRTLA